MKAITIIVVTLTCGSLVLAWEQQRIYRHRVYNADRRNGWFSQLTSGFLPQSPGHEEKVHHKVVSTKVPVPYTVIRKVPYVVEKKVPVKYKVPVPQPYFVEKKIPVPYKEVMKVPYYVPKPYTVIKKIPVPVNIGVPKPYEVKIDVPRPVEVEKKIPVPVKVYIPQPYTVEKKVPYPVKIPVYIPQPYTVERKVPVEVKVPVERPVPVEVPKPYTVVVEKPVEVEVEKRVPYEVKVPVERPYIVEVPKLVPYKVPVHTTQASIEKPTTTKVETNEWKPSYYQLSSNVEYMVQHKHHDHNAAPSLHAESYASLQPKNLQQQYDVVQYKNHQYEQDPSAAPSLQTESYASLQPKDPQQQYNVVQYKNHQYEQDASATPSLQTESYATPQPKEPQQQPSDSTWHATSWEPSNKTSDMPDVHNLVHLHYKQPEQSYNHYHTSYVQHTPHFLYLKEEADGKAKLLDALKQGTEKQETVLPYPYEYQPVDTQTEASHNLQIVVTEAPETTTQTTTDAAATTQRTRMYRMGHIIIADPNDEEGIWEQEGAIDWLQPSVNGWTPISTKS